MTKTDAQKRRIAADNGLHNVLAAFDAAERADIPFSVACALLEKESHGENVYGHDEGGALSGFPNPVTKDNFEVFYWLVMVKGQTSNGVGPCQITFKGYFDQMKTEGLQPWKVSDNMYFGFRLLKSHYNNNGHSWEAAGSVYNGSAAYGADLDAKIKVWVERFR